MEAPWIGAVRPETDAEAETTGEDARVGRGRVGGKDMVSPLSTKLLFLLGLL